MEGFRCKAFVDRIEIVKTKAIAKAARKESVHPEKEASVQNSTGGFRRIVFYFGTSIFRFSLTSNRKTRILAARLAVNTAAITSLPSRSHKVLTWITSSNIEKNR